MGFGESAKGAGLALSCLVLVGVVRCGEAPSPRPTPTRRADTDGRLSVEISAGPRPMPSRGIEGRSSETGLDGRAAAPSAGGACAQSAPPQAAEAGLDPAPGAADAVGAGRQRGAAVVPMDLGAADASVGDRHGVGDDAAMGTSAPAGLVLQLKPAQAQRIVSQRAHFTAEILPEDGVGPPGSTVIVWSAQPAGLATVLGDGDLVCRDEGRVTVIATLAGSTLSAQAYLDCFWGP